MTSMRAPLEEKEHNPMYLFNKVAQLTNNKSLTGVDISQQHSNDDFMNYTIRDHIVTMQPLATVPQFHSFSTIGKEELYKLVKSAKPHRSSFGYY